MSSDGRRYLTAWAFCAVGAAALAAALLVAGCGWGPQPAQSPPTPPAKGAPMPPLIPRELLFGNPEKAGPELSPDGKRLAYIAPDAAI